MTLTGRLDLDSVKFKSYFPGTQTDTPDRLLCLDH